MRPAYHFAASSLIAGVSYLATQSPPIAASTFAIGFLIDADHLFDYSIYCVQKRRWLKLKELLNLSHYPPPTKIYIPLHAYELLLLIWAAALYFLAFPWALWLSFSMGMHLLMDYLAYRPHPLCYSLIFRMTRGFDHERVWQPRAAHEKGVPAVKDRSSYDRGYSSRPFELRIPGDALKDRIIYRAIQKTDYRGKRLLDLGCGMGHTASLLSELVDVVGIDFSEEAISIASKKSRGAFICNSAEELPFPDNFFDYVVAKDILEHVPDDSRVLDEIRRVCRDDAVLLMYLPCKLEGFNFSTESIVKKVTGYTLDPEVGHLRRYTPRQAKEMLQSRGCKNIRAWYFVHFSLGIVSLASVKGYQLLSRRKQAGEKVISGAPLFLLKTVFGMFEFLGRIEASILKTLPGAGFFLLADAGEGSNEALKRK